jgi:hypothetical protein
MVKDGHKRMAVNEAARSLRDQADRDYICARHLYALGFADQFMWQAQQTLEKYLKAVILFCSALPHESGTGVQRLTGYGHRLPLLLDDVQKIEPWRPELPEDVCNHVDHVYRMGLNRYGDQHVYRLGDELPNLDKAVWNIRRWCRYNACIPPKKLQAKMTPDLWIQAMRESLRQMKPGTSQHLKGLLESIIAERRRGLWRHARASLLRWNHWFYAKRPSSVLPPRWSSSSRPVWDRRETRDPEIAALLESIGVGRPRSSTASPSQR